MVFKALSKRSQLVSCHNTLSSEKDIEIGIPQGSVLGPLLFIIYINDITQHIHLGTANLYADDTLIYCSATSFSELKLSLMWENGIEVIS